MSVVSTTALTACGGSDGDGSKTFTPPGTPAPAPAPTPAEPTPAEPTPAEPTPATPPGSDTQPTNPTVVDPTGSKAAVIDNIDLSQTPTVVGQNYIRNAGANFDYVSNNDSKKNASSIALGSIDLDSQNPDLTNIVVGYDGEKSAEGVTIKRFVGNIPNSPVTSQTFKSNNLQKDANGQTVTTEQTVNLQSLQTVNSGKGTGNGAQSAIALGTTGDDAGTTGLISGTGITGSFTSTDIKNNLKGREEDNTLTTRIFGKNYLDTTNSVNNSYRFDNTNSDAALPIGNALAPTQIKLNNVQYGRVSSNIDALSTGQTGLDNFVVSDYRNKNAADAVSNYFYRGTGETSIADMQNVIANAKDATYTYLGHAITYGLDNAANGATGSNTPNSFGTGTQVEVLGNFVRADYKPSTGNVTGNIYNAVKTTTNLGTANAATTVAPVNLVNFTGTATGNTVIGNSTRVSDSSNGLFRASFYGKNAEEMGGSVNSINSGYGTAEWGGVFGAQRAVEAPAPAAPVVVPGNQNGWLIQSPN